MGAQELITLLQEALLIYEDEKKDEGEEIEISTRTFEEAQLLTSNKGLVVRVNGQEFQLEILDSSC